MSSKAQLKVIHVTCAIIENDKKEIFVAQRPEGKSLAGYWEFPGGKIEKGETPSESLIREIKEELDIDIEVFNPLTKSVYKYEFGEIHLQPFKAKIKKGEMKLLEHANSLWLKREELSKLNWSPADIPIMQELQNSSKLLQSH